MKRLILALVLFCIPGSSAAPVSIAQLAWLQGCWSLEMGGRVVEEQWNSPRGGTMLGTSRTIKAGKTSEYEFVIIQERGDALVYEAHPSGQAGAQFTSIKIESDQVIFENKEHDFPQRIGYRKVANGVEAWIEGTVGGKSRKIDFPYKRTSCPGQ